MSRFFGANSDSESDQENDQEVQGDSLVPQQVPRFADVLESSSEEDEKRVVRSEKEKRWAAMQDTIKLINNHIKINDWTALSGDFDLLNKQLAQSKTVTAKEGIPDFYFKAIVALENANDAAGKKLKVNKKAMNKTNAVACNAMKQKLRKHRTQYASQLAAFSKAPKKTASGSEEEEEEEENDDPYQVSGDADDAAAAPPPAARPAKAPKAPKAPVEVPDEPEPEAEEDDGDAEPEEDEFDDDDVKQKPKKSKPAADDEDDEDAEDQEDEDEWDEDDASDTSDDSDIDLTAATITRDFWVKKKKDNDDAPADKEKRTRKIKAPKERKIKEKTEEVKKEIEYTPEVVKRKLRELIALFGRRGTDKKQMIADLTILASKAGEPTALLKVKTTLATALFDTRLGVDFMPIDSWKQCYGVVESIIATLDKHGNVRLSEDEKVVDALEEEEEKSKMEAMADDKKAEDAEAEAAAAPKPTDDKDKVYYVAGNLYSFVSGLNSELKKSLQTIDPHTQDYIDRLRDEKDLLSLMVKARGYYRKIAKLDFEASVALLQLELEYYHYHPSLDRLMKNDLKLDEKGQLQLTASESNEIETGVVPELAKFIYEKGDPRERTRAVLCHIFYFSLHNYFDKARDLLLMSHVQDTIGNTDIPTRILFNRCVAQLGLCAFRTGDSRQALYCLNELFQSGRSKELLAQGVYTRWNERDVEREKREKQWQYPFHMHLNTDSLEGVHLVSAMLAEVPNLAMHGLTNRKRIISKYFRRFYENHVRQAFNGPPENTREIVMAASKALLKGEWKVCIEYISNLKLWDFLPRSEIIKKALYIKIREVALKTYLLSYGASYSSVSTSLLAQMFELDDTTVFKLTSTMMVNEQLLGAWDEPSNSIIMHQVDPSRVQKAALKYADKIAVFVEQNDRLLSDQRGFYGKSQNFGQGRFGDRSRGGRQGNDRGDRDRDRGDRGDRGDRPDRERGDRGDRGDGQRRGGDRNFRRRF